jgi:hypothetical protein
MKFRSVRFPIPIAALIAATYLLLSAGCARIADPQPPRILVPKSAVDLTCRQLARSIVLSVSMPDLNTDGSRIPTLQRVDIFRVMEPVIEEEIAAPISEKQFLAQAVRIQSIPEAEFPDHLNDKTFIVRDEPHNTPESTFYTSLFRYAVAFVNNKGQAAGLSNQVTIRPIRVAAPPQGISGEVTEHAVRLKWTPPPALEGTERSAIEGYNIYRSEQPDLFPSSPINALPVKNPEFEDEKFQYNKTYYYAVSTIGSLQNPSAESLRSSAIQIETRDVFPPAPPKDFNALFEKGVVLLLWAPSSSSDVVGYRIIRQEKGEEKPQRLQQDLIPSLSYRDAAVESGKLYEYSIQAIDSSGNASSDARVEVQTQ